MNLAITFGDRDLIDGPDVSRVPSDLHHAPRLVEAFEGKVARWHLSRMLEDQNRAWQRAAQPFPEMLTQSYSAAQMRHAPLKGARRDDAPDRGVRIEPFGQRGRMMKDA